MLLRGNYSVDDLTKILGIKARTIHFWVQSELLDGPGAGRGSRYTDEHLARLFLIQQLREARKPLPDIRAALRRLTPRDYAALVEQAKQPRVRKESTARELIDGWLRDPHGRATEGSTGLPGSASGVLPGRGIPRRWERISLAPDVELHVQHPLSESAERLKNRLIEVARRAAKEVL